MPDFTLRTLRLLLTTLKDRQYTFQTFVAFLKDPAPRAIILRHDVDARKLNSLRTAQIEADLGITGTYNFRIVPQSFDEDIIRRIAAMGHEIGYHYEDLAMAKGNYGKAILSFEQNLAKLRQLVPVETICMHGSPLSKFDNRKIWEKYNYRNYGIIGEPYFDLDFNSVLYLTDTGRRWDGEKVSVRDKIAEPKTITKNTGQNNNSSGDPIPIQTGLKQNDLNLQSLQSTNDIIKAAKNNQLPAQMMITVHPQRWDNRPLIWLRELLWQNIKNMGKKMIAGSSNQ